MVLQVSGNRAFGTIRPDYFGVSGFEWETPMNMESEWIYGYFVGLISGMIVGLTLAFLSW